MIEATHSLQIDAGIASVWDYVQDIRKWAVLFPGCQECEVIDEHHSKWVIKVGAGGMVKTVNVMVHVQGWDGPGNVDFTYQLASEPVVGSGSYRATPLGPEATEVSLHLVVEGSGSMAPMWEAMCKPLLPQMARAFSGKLKNEIEQAAGITPEPAVSWVTRLARWLRGWFSRAGTP
ncbi:CoxG family protein [Haliea sp. E17]|uniref:CoxG family protein n=1 Tax=Haliea sp. E17 TaxID=3401576 RepID=UPI003AAEB5A9